MEKHISTSEARRRLGCTAQTVRNLIKAGKIKAAQMENGHFLIDAISLQSFQENEGKDVLVAKKAKPKPKVWQNPKPKSAENPGNILAQEVSERYCRRPEWLHLYQFLLETEINLDHIAVECVFRTPEGGIDHFCSVAAYSLPDDPFQFEEELFFDWPVYDLEGEAAKNYLATAFRWWMQLTYQNKVIIRSRDDREPVAGLKAWVDEQVEATKDERKMLLAQAQKRGQEDIVNLVLFGGAVALGLVLGLTGTSRGRILANAPQPVPKGE